MTGYYDPNKDYSKELQRTDLTDAQRAQLQQERQNKIDDKYGGVEPVMTGSNKTYTQTYGKSGGSSGQSAGSVYGVIDVGGRTGPGDAVKGTRPNTAMRKDLAGQTVQSGNWVIRYDEDGYAKVLGKGQISYTPHQDYYVQSGSYNGGNLWTDEEMLTATDLARIASIRAQLNAGQLTGDQANQLANQIRSGYGYTIDKSGNVTDLGALSAVDASRQKWGMPINPTSAEQQAFLQLMFPEQGTSDSGALLSAMYALSQGDYHPKTNYSAAQNAAGIGGIVGATGGLAMGGYDDMTQYINDMYAQSLEAELAALKSVYDSNVAELESQNDRIAEQYRAARNQAAGQNELQRMQMNELGIAQGLNTGATGQMALAQNMAYQGNLGNLLAQEAQTQADVDLALAQLLSQYNANVNQTAAQINAQRNQALYNEMVRQQEWAAQQAELSREYALNLLSNGIMPDSATLSSGGISANEAAALVQMVTGGGVTGTPQIGTGTTTMVPTETSVPSFVNRSYDNEGLSENVIKMMQRHINQYLPANEQIAVDGKWGSATTAAANGATANQYLAVLEDLRAG